MDITKESLEAKGYEVKTTYIESGYDVNEENDKLLWADVVYLQTPVYWFGLPSLFKSYIDKVLMVGYAQGTTLTGDGRTREDLNKKYGSGGLLTNKKYMVCSTWNSPAEAFNDKEQFFEGLSVDQVLTPLHKSYQFLGMNKIPSFTFFDIFKGQEEVSKQVEEFKKHISTHF